MSNVYDFFISYTVENSTTKEERVGRIVYAFKNNQPFLTAKQINKIIEKLYKTGWGELLTIITFHSITPVVREEE